jgi:hypothetical protein
MMVSTKFSVAVITSAIAAAIPAREILVSVSAPLDGTASPLLTTTSMAASSQTKEKTIFTWHLVMRVYHCL